MAKKQQETKNESRWFKVTGEHFDWVPKFGTMISFPKGSIGFRPRACIDAGLAQGVIEVIEKPNGYTVDKAGNVVKNGH